MYQRPKSTDCLVISVGRSGISVSLDIRCRTPLRRVDVISDVDKPLIIVAIRKVRAVVATAALLTPQRGAGDQQADGDDGADSTEFRVVQRAWRRASHERVPCL